MDLAAPPPPWLDELPLTLGPPWVTMGLRAVDPADWLVVDDDYAAQLAEKEASGDKHVFGAEPGTEASGAEVRALVETWIAEHGPPIVEDRLAGSRRGGP